MERALIDTLLLRHLANPSHPESGKIDITIPTQGSWVGEMLANVNFDASCHVCKCQLVT